MQTLLEEAPVQHKITPIRGRSELTASYVQKLHDVANELEQRANALRRHARHLRREANSIQAAAGQACLPATQHDDAAVSPGSANRGRAKLIQFCVTKS